MWFCQCDLLHIFLCTWNYHFVHRPVKVFSLSYQWVGLIFGFKLLVTDGMPADIPILFQHKMISLIYACFLLMLWFNSSLFFLPKTLIWERDSRCCICAIWHNWWKREKSLSSRPGTTAICKYWSSVELFWFIPGELNIVRNYHNIDPRNTIVML